MCQGHLAAKILCVTACPNIALVFDEWYGIPSDKASDYGETRDAAEGQIPVSNAGREDVRSV
jgi:hypothetical protein